MPIFLRRRLAVALLGVALLSPPGVAAKIDRFQDDQGTLHITNHGETPVDKSVAETKPVRGRLSQEEVLSQETFLDAAPPPQAPTPPPPGHITPPPREEAARPEPITPPPQAPAPAPKAGRFDGARGRGRR